MKILVVSSFLPYPLHSGGHVRLYNLLSRLSRNHEITLVCEKRAIQRAEDLEEVSKICKVYTVPRGKQWSLKNILKAGFSKNPFLITGHTNSQMKKIISNLLSQNSYDLIHVETSYVFQNLPQNIKIPVVLVEHNVEYMVYKKFAQSAPFFIRPILYLDIAKLEKIEKDFWKSADKLVAVSQREAQIMNADYIVPNGVDTDKFKLYSGGNKILFIGDFKWLQNRDSAQFILNEIWPKVIDSKRVKKENSLWVVGRKIPEYIKKIGGENVVFDENSPSDTYEIYKQSKILLAPIRVGGGTSFKILESMASGVPVVTTSLGNEGIGAKDKESVVLADSAEEFAYAINTLLEDKDYFETIAKNARKLIEQKYSWDKISLELERVYKEVVS